jgi:hypothetical protein
VSMQLRASDERRNSPRTKGALRTRPGASSAEAEPVSARPLPCGGNTVRPCID